MVFLGFVLGTWLAVYRAKKVGIKPDIVLDLVVWILVSSIVGARGMYIIFHLDEFQGRWLDMISPIQSDGSLGIAGLVVLGGVMTAIPVAAWYLKRKKISFSLMLDILVPSLALGMGIGRLGCLLNGCCFGHPTDFPWGMIFPDTCLAGSIYLNQPIHPTQLYAVFYNLAILSILLIRSPLKRFNGELFYLFLALYGLSRFINEIFRYYRHGMVMINIGSFEFTISMLISLSMVVFGLILLVRGYSKPREIQ